MFVTSVLVSSSLLALTLWAGGNLLAQSLTLVAAWGLIALGRFTLLRSWVFRSPPEELGGGSVLTRT
jgi:hypothetical protein